MYTLTVIRRANVRQNIITSLVAHLGIRETNVVYAQTNTLHSSSFSQVEWLALNGGSKFGTRKRMSIRVARPPTAYMRVFWGRCTQSGPSQTPCLPVISKLVIHSRCPQFLRDFWRRETGLRRSWQWQVSEEQYDTVCWHVAIYIWFSQSNCYASEHSFGLAWKYAHRRQAIHTFICTWVTTPRDIRWLNISQSVSLRAATKLRDTDMRRCAG